MTPSQLKRLRNWMEANALDPVGLSRIDVNAEFGGDLSLDEAILVARQKFSTLWRSDSEVSHERRSMGDRPKQIIFVKSLINKIVEGTVRVTYRKAPKIGTYYVISNRFRHSAADSSRLLIEFYQTDAVDPYQLTDKEAQLAGVNSATEIRGLFEMWYGVPIPNLYRNWFKVKEIACPSPSPS